MIDVEAGMMDYGEEGEDEEQIESEENEASSESEIEDDLNYLSDKEMREKLKEFAEDDSQSESDIEGESAK